MGCSVSRSANFIQNPTPYSPSSSSSNSQFQSPLTDPSSTPIPRTASLPTPLVHHPPLKKGDSNHFVALTSTTYGSIVIVDSPNPNFNGHDHPSPPPSKLQEFRNSEDPLSPDSVINTWELMEGLDDDEDDERDGFEFVHHIDLINESKIEPKIANLVSSENDYRIVLYYTSLRGIRKTYEDCCLARTIFQGFNVRVDEKDISMDRSYRVELQEALNGKPMSLPQVFIKGSHIGGADEIKQLNETGELGKMLESFPVMDSVGGRSGSCRACGDARFVPCRNCNGSRKVYEEDRGVSRKCLDCNENGLVRCIVCCP